MTTRGATVLKYDSCLSVLAALSVAIIAKYRPGFTDSLVLGSSRGYELLSFWQVLATSCMILWQLGDIHLLCFPSLIASLGAAVYPRVLLCMPN